MTGKDRIVLQKVMDYAYEAIQYADGMSFEDFMNDRKTISACAFCIGQMGELVKEIETVI